MLDTFAKQKFRLGVVAGFVYADSRVNDFISNPAHSDWIVPVASDAENLRNLLAGAIDGFLADRIAAATTAWRRNAGARIEEHPLRFSTDIRFMLSRARMAVIVTVLGVLLTRIAAIACGMKGWRYI